MNNMLQQNPGLPCPECRFHIQVAILHLLSGQQVQCPACGLTLAIDKQASKEGLQAIKHLHHGLQAAEQKKAEATAFGR